MNWIGEIASFLASFIDPSIGFTGVSVAWYLHHIGIGIGRH